MEDETRCKTDSRTRHLPMRILAQAQNLLKALGGFVFMTAKWLHRSDKWSRPVLWVSLGCTVALSIAMACTQSMSQTATAVSQAPEDQAPVHPQQVSEVAESIFQSLPSEAPAEIKAPAQIKDPKEQLHPEHFEPPLEPQLIPEESISEPYFIV
jgi:hypothetical protein